VSALVKRDIGAAELNALEQLLFRFERNEISLVCSTAVENELMRIPSGYRGPHLRQLKLFGSIPRIEPGGLTRLTLAGVPGTNWDRVLWERLRELLPDEDDAKHVFVASSNRVQYLVTVDGRTLLRHRAAVLNLSGVRLVTPSEFMNAEAIAS
jgi:hypothetical protein